MLYALDLHTDANYISIKLVEKNQGGKLKKQGVEEGFKPSVATKRANVLPLPPAAAHEVGCTLEMHFSKAVLHIEYSQ